MDGHIQGATRKVLLSRYPVQYLAINVAGTALAAAGQLARTQGGVTAPGETGAARNPRRRSTPIMS